MLCSVCREDLDFKRFNENEYLHARIHLDVPKCIVCSRLSRAAQSSKRMTALESLGAPTIRAKILSAKKIAKAERKRIAQAKRRERRQKAADRAKSLEWSEMNHAEKRASLLARRTPSELALDRALTMAGVKFHPQHAFGGYWIDFRVYPGLLGVEVDGGYHFTKDQKAKDDERTAFLERNGWTIIRFTNEEVDDNPARVVAAIKASAQPRKKEKATRIVVIPPAKAS